MSENKSKSDVVNAAKNIARGINGVNGTNFGDKSVLLLINTSMKRVLNQFVNNAS